MRHAAIALLTAALWAARWAARWAALWAPFWVPLWASTASADGNRRLHVAIHGSVDEAALGQALARELGLDVEVVEGTCQVPCLDITVDGHNAATVVYAPRSGPPRARAMTLGSDAAQWPVVLTLLAGNVVRDEAQDVLAGLPERDLPRPPGAPLAVAAPPDPASDASVPPPVVRVMPMPVIAPVDAAPPPPGEHRAFGFGLVPGLSTDLTHVGSIRHAVSVDLLVGVSGGSTALSLSGIADIERGEVSGAQLGGIAVWGTRVSGTQIGGIAAVSGDVDGVQVAGIAAVADRVNGVQAGGIAAVARRDGGNQIAGIAAVDGGAPHVQLAGVASVAGASSRLQLAGIASVAHGDADVQAGGVTNVAQGTAHVQVAGVVNVADRITGVQIAPINVARTVEGVQVGVINYGGSADGFSFGLINIVPGGRYDLETAVDSDRIGTVLFRHGGRRWHNVYGVGGHRVDDHSQGNDDVWMYGLGFGPTIRIDNTMIDIEAVSWQVNHGPRHESTISILNQARLSVAHYFGPFAIVAGGMLNVYVTDDHTSPLFTERTSTGTGSSGSMSTGITTTIWPSAFIGLRI